MPSAPTNAESWKRMVLRSMPAPAWLSEDAPHGDVVLSSRCRTMRNLRGHHFPHHASTEELRQIADTVVDSANPGLQVHKKLTAAEREYLLGCRLISPDFLHRETGRLVLLDSSRTCSVMVNEEDHVRIQAITSGWSIASAEGAADGVLGALGPLSYAWTPDRGHLAASPYNAGAGRRWSAMFHLIGLAGSRRLGSVMRALASQNIVVRGLFGETSRAIGAFVQVSATAVTGSEYEGACEYLRREERDARTSLGRTVLERRSQEALDYAISSRSISLADALRVLAWVRWAASAEIAGYNLSPRKVDSWLTTLEIRSSSDEESAARTRAESLRRLLEAVRE